MDDLRLDIDMDLDLGILASRGRKTMPLSLEIVRPLTVADLAMLAGNRETPSLDLKRLSQRHHGLARSLASGVGSGEAAMIHGYTGGRVSILLSDPAFKELVSFYGEKVDNAFEHVAESMAALSRDALIELQDRLEDTPDEFTNKELLTIASDLLDRTGHGKQSTTLNINANLGDRLNEARKRALEARMIEAQSVMKDITPETPDA